MTHLIEIICATKYLWINMNHNVKERLFSQVTKFSGAYVYFEKYLNARYFYVGCMESCSADKIDFISWHAPSPLETSCILHRMCKFKDFMATNATVKSSTWICCKNLLHIETFCWNFVCNGIVRQVSWRCYMVQFHPETYSWKKLHRRTKSFSIYQGLILFWWWNVSKLCILFKKIIKLLKSKGCEFDLINPSSHFLYLLPQGKSPSLPLHPSC